MLEGSELIPSVSISPSANIKWIKSLFEKYVSKCDLESYTLPCDDDATVVVGISGGADSAVLSLLVACYLAPSYDVRFLFSDTGAEPESAYATIEKIEEITGIKVERIAYKHTLFEMIEAAGGFLPSHRDRTCTGQLKAVPTIKYLKQFDKCINLAGIRVDEADREGLKFVYSMEKDREKENSLSAFPFVDLGINKEAVFDILHKTIGIPETYRFRSRSGCYACFMQRNQELVGMFFERPDYFEKTAGYERLSDADKARWPMQDILRDQGVRGYYPVPKFVDINTPLKERAEYPEPVRGKAKKDADTMDMFSNEQEKVRMYAAFALYIHPMMGMYETKHNGVYQQHFISFSTSRGGLVSALGNYVDFKKSTPDPAVKHEHMHIIMVAIDFPGEVLDSEKPSKESYTWKSDVAYKQIAHIVTHIQATLEYKQACEELADAKHEAVMADKRGDISGYFHSYEMAQRAAWQKYKAKRSMPQGEVVWEALYRAKERVKDNQQLGLEMDEAQPASFKKSKMRGGIEYDDAARMCIACSF